MANRRNVTSSHLMYGSNRPKPIPKRGRGVRPQQSTTKWLIRAGLVVAGLYLLWRPFGISKLSVSGNSAIPSADIIKLANTSFSGHWFSRNLLTLWLAPVASDIEADQRVDTVSLVRHWPSSLAIVITERHISLGWRSGNNSYLLDSNGVAVGLLSTNVSVPVVTDSTSLPVQVGDRVVPQSFVSFTTALASELTPATGLVIANMSVPDTTSEIYVKTATGYVVKFDTTSGVEEQLQSLKLVEATLAKLKKTPSQYIDLRVPGKAYYQ